MVKLQEAGCSTTVSLGCPVGALDRIPLPDRAADRGWYVPGRWRGLASLGCARFSTWSATNPRLCLFQLCNQIFERQFDAFSGLGEGNPVRQQILGFLEQGNSLRVCRELDLEMHRGKRLNAGRDYPACDRRGRLRFWLSW